MAYVNVAEWTPDKVTDWLKGLDDSMNKYLNSFTNNEVGGRQLLNIRPYELEQLGMSTIGHQEIVLEAVENLRNFHYNLDKENLQFMALHVATTAGSLHRQLAADANALKIETHILNDITRTISTIKPLISWLERAPFQGQIQFKEICRNMLRLGLEMATMAQRDRFVERPREQIRSTAEKLERLADYIIQDITDPMLLQPASLNLLTLKKRESDLGFNIQPSYHGVHRVTDIKYNSPAHNSGKIEDGDEIVQINFQTVVGWQYKTVLMQLRESPPDVYLTLKKRPKHTKIYGQIYMQPYRLPSKKRAIGTRWGENLPSPRTTAAGANNSTTGSVAASFLTVPEDPLILPITLETDEKKVTVVASSSDTDSSCSDILTPTDTKINDKEMRLYYPKPRAMLQRRNTICGDEFHNLKSFDRAPLWHERKTGSPIVGDPSSPSLRDKSVSFGFGLEVTPRPTTCIGISNAGATNKFSNDIKSLLSDTKKLKQVPEIGNEQILKHGKHNEEKPSKPGVSKVVRFNANMKYEDYKRVDEKYTCNVDNTILETFEPIPFADDEDEDAIEMLRNTTDKAEDIIETLYEITKSKNISMVEAVNIPVVARRGRLDKSHSTPAYDNSGEESETPPAIEPRKDMLSTPPIPPPRPRKKDSMTIIVPPPPPKPLSLQNQNIMASSSSPSTSNIICSNIDTIESTSMSSLILPDKNKNVIKQSLSDFAVDKCDIHTPTKTRTLTLKKKHNLISKRRNINLKILGTGDIQGHLCRRTKDRRGVTYWARVYFVMLDTILYGFRSKDAPKASCVIFLPGFTVSLAKEVHSKPYAFKVYHSAKTFYFAAESQDALNQWVEFIRQATLQFDKNTLTHNKTNDAQLNNKDLFSETESSGEENELIISNNLSTPSPQNSKDITTTITNVLRTNNANLTSSSAIATTPLSSTLAASASSASSTSSTPSTNTKHDRRYLGSLRKLTKGTLPFKSSSTNEKKLSSDIPVPTEQYRSYRKVPGGSFGIQIGTNTPGYHHDTILHSPINTNITAISQPLPSTPTTPSTLSVGGQQPPIPSSSSPSSTIIQSDQISIRTQRKLSISSSRSSVISNSESISCLGPPSSPAPVPSITASIAPIVPINNNLIASIHSNGLQTPDGYGRHLNKISYNFIHASNPNLVEIDFQTSKTLDYSLPKINAGNAWDAHQNIQQGFAITLKDLMLQKQEEEAQEMYNNRVLLGVEKKDEQKRLLQRRLENKLTESQNSNSNETTQQQQKMRRSLPRTPDYEISFKPDDEDIRRTRTKEGQKLRDFGYELISGDDPMENTTNTTLAQRQNSNTSTASSNTTEHHQEHSWSHFLRSQLATHKHKKHSSSSSCSLTYANDESGSGVINDKRAGSFKKKGKLEVVKSSSERIFQFGKHSSTNSSSGMTMTLPLNKKSKHVTLETTNAGNGGGGGGNNNNGIKKSHTYNNDLKEKAGIKYDSQRKNSAPMPLFAKLSFSSSNSSQSSPSYQNNNKVSGKKLLGSPLLHRTLFGNLHNTMNTNINTTTTTTTTPTTPTYTEREYDREIFSQVLLPSHNHGHHHSYGQHHHHHHHHQQQQHHHQQSQLTFQHHNQHYTDNNLKLRQITTNANIIAPDVIAPPPPVSVPATPPPIPPYNNEITTSTPITTTITTTPPTTTTTTTPTSSSSTTTTTTPPEYPNMKCPPVFEPEIYSLTDPNASLNLLLKRNNGGGGGGGGNGIGSTITDENQ